MARLPVYTNEANIRVADPVKITGNQAWDGVGKAAKIGTELAVRWQKTQNAAESLDGKNRMIAAANDVLDEAENFTDYKTPADLKRKEDELLGKLDGILPEVTSGFTNDMNASDFSAEYQLTMAQNSEKLKSIFRSKYIDNNAANLTLSKENNMKAYVSTGNEAYKNSYLADLENSFKAGYLSEEEKTKQALSVNDWEQYRVLREAETDPEAVIANLKSGNYNIKPENMNDLLTNLNSIKTNKKLLDQYEETARQDAGESETTAFIYGSSTYDEKLQYINNKEFSGDISGAFAVKARRAIRQFKPDAEKRVSNAQSMADVLQRVYDLNSGAVDSTEYLNGIRSIRESVVDLHSSGEITTKDAMSLNNQISTATRARVAEATFDVSYKFNDARDYFKTTLPPEYQNEAIRDLFYSTQDLNLDGKSEKEIDRIYQKKAVEISNNILKNGRLNAEKAYQNITAASDDQFISSLASQRGVDTETINKDIDETAQKYGISREEVINRLKGNM